MPLSQQDLDETTPAWIRRPRLVHGAAYALAGLVVVAQLVAVVVQGSGTLTVLAVLLAGAGAAVSWRLPWLGLLMTAGASLAVTAVDRDPLSVWMVAVLVLFSATFRGRQPVAATALVGAVFLAAFMTVGGFRGGAVVGSAALFCAIGGGAAGAALRFYRENWLVVEERARDALATRELEATRRVVEERLRISRDLHDVVGHQVAMLSVHLGVAELGLPEDAERSRRAMVSARASARNVVVETQRILTLLRRDDPPTAGEALQPTPSVRALGDLVASFRSIGLDVDARVEVDPDAVEPSVGVAVYRVVQEALTNAHRHGAGAASVVLDEAEDHRSRTLVVTVRNDLDPSTAPPDTPGGHGLVGMRERVESCGGELKVERSGGQFVVRARFDQLPVEVA